VIEGTERGWGRCMVRASCPAPGGPMAAGVPNLSRATSTMSGHRRTERFHVGGAVVHQRALARLRAHVPDEPRSPAPARCLAG
jgi:hypothetical protein